MDSDLAKECQNQSYQSENEIPTPFDIKEIKQMLMAGDKHKILKSIKKIEVFSQKDEGLAELISCDISEFLCDAITPFDAITSRAVHSCLEAMVQHPHFFIQSHSCFVVESLIRTVHFLIKNPNGCSSLGEWLSLLVLISHGYNTFLVIPEKKTVASLLHLLQVLLKSSTAGLQNKYQIGCIIANLINLNLSIWNPENLHTVAENIFTWIDLIKDNFHSEHPMRENLISLCSLLCHSVLKLIVLKGVSLEQSIPESFVKVKDDLLIRISNFLVNCEAPYLDGLSLSVIESEPTKAEYFFHSLLYFYRDEISAEKNYITHGLSEAGFLQFVTRIISFAENGHDLRKLGVLVLSHVVISLSEDVFQISTIWPKGLDDFRSQLLQGFSELPLDATQWLDSLINPRSPSFCKIALLLYLYFYCMTAKSQSILETIYPPIVIFINFSSGIESSVLLVKIVWFVFVMSQLSCSQNTRPENEAKATNKMACILEVQNDLTLIYTHHPALLYWAFSSPIVSSIQCKIVRLWLQNKSADCKELEDLIKKSSDARSAILDILQNECGQVLDFAFSTLNSVVREFDEDNLIFNIWFLLPKILAKYTTDSASAKNVDYFIKLCSLKTPENFDITKVIRVASLLPKVLIKSDLISIMPSLTLTLKLLEFGFGMNDPRVMHVFLRFDEFMERIIKGMESSVLEIAAVSLKIVTLIWRNGSLYHKPKSQKIIINKETILTPLDSKFFEVTKACLAFLHVMLLNEFDSPVFEIKEIDSNFIEILFFEVQNTCMKGMTAISSMCWCCLKAFLKLDAARKEFANLELTTDPLLHELIDFHLPHLQESREMKDFLMIWLDRNNSVVNNPCFNRKIFGQLFRETLQKIASHLKCDLKEEDKILYEKVLKFGYCD